MKTIKLPWILMGFCVIFLLRYPTFITAQEKRALLIGVNTYAPDVKTAMEKGSDWRNLQGTLNDVDAVRSILQNKYGFSESNIRVLEEDKASRNGILQGLSDLTEKSKKGDIVFVYYSGHGSQVRNTMSPEKNDFFDEAIVPSDAIDGAKYIRDKELAAVFNQMLDKGLLLTVVFDCCHSGSMTRGIPSAEPDLVKKLPMDTVDVKDPTVIKEPPASKGALIISASQDYQTAEEIPKGENELPHGKFTDAFIKALREAAPGESAYDIFSRTSAYIKYKCYEQVPVLECTRERGDKTVFGETESHDAGEVLVAVKAVDKFDGAVELNGGMALGFVEGSQFRMVGKPDIIIEVTALDGMASAIAKPIKGTLADIKAGDLFEMTNWGIPDRPNLYVYTPPADLSYATLLQTTEKLQTFCLGKNIRWVAEPDNEKASNFVFYTKEGWILMDENAHKTALGKNIEEKLLNEYLTPGKSSLYFVAPPFLHMLDSVNIGKNSKYSLVEYSDAGIAEYQLAGRWKDNKFEYCWILPGLSNQDGKYYGSLPLRTNWFPAINSPEGIQSVGDSLTSNASRLGRIMAWMNLPSPPNGNTFPYRFGLKNSSTNQVTDTGSVKGGEKYYPVLIRDRKNLTWNGQKRWIYIFSIDIDGKIGLIFPLDAGVENHLPYDNQANEDIIVLGNRRIIIGPPFGNDTYFLLTSSEEIPAPQEVFNSDPVKTLTKGNFSPLAQFFSEIGVNSRGTPMEPAPKEWSIQRVNILSVAP